MTLNYRSKKYLDMTPAQRREYDLKMCKRPPTTDLQRLAQKENFALFQLKGMKGNASHMLHMDSEIPAAVLTTIIEACNRGISRIKAEQYNRKEARKSK